MDRKLNGACCRGKPHKLIIVDLNMPRMGGVEFMRVVKERMNARGVSGWEAYRDSKFVLSTAQGDLSSMSTNISDFHDQSK